MQTPNRHMRYRRSVYRKKRIKIIIAAVLAAIAVTVILFAIIGNALGNKVEENVVRRTSKNAQTEQDEHVSVKSVMSYPVPLSDESSKLSSRLSKATENGYKDVSFELNSKDGALLYSSPIAQQLGKQMTGIELWSLSDATKLCKDNGLYVTGTIRLNDFYSDDDLARAASLGYYSALVSEALRNGIDDVLIYVENIPTERYSELVGLADEIHRLCPDGHIGLSLPSGVFSDQALGDTVELLWTTFDYLATDLSSPPEGVNALDHVNSGLGGMLYYLLRYNVRVLVPYSDDADVNSTIVEAVASTGSKNIQFMP